MPKRLISQRHNRLFREAVLGLINDLSKKYSVFAVVVDDRSACPNCEYDNANETSNNTYKDGGPQPFTNICPVCEGSYWIETEKKRKLKATVNWGGATNKENDIVQGGQLPKDHAKVKTELNKAALMRDADYFLIDGDRCTRVGRIETRGLTDKVVAEMVVKRDG